MMARETWIPSQTENDKTEVLSKRKRQASPVIPAKAGIYKEMDTRLRGYDKSKLVLSRVDPSSDPPHTLFVFRTAGSTSNLSYEQAWIPSQAGNDTGLAGFYKMADSRLIFLLELTQRPNFQLHSNLIFTLL